MHDDEEPIYPFAYRVHAHSLGVVVTGFKYTRENNSWIELAKGNPQSPQAFYPMKNDYYSVSKNEILAARCTYNSSSRNRETRMGSTANDEMCNLYIMYFTKARRGKAFQNCVDIQFPDLVFQLPVANDQIIGLPEQRSLYNYVKKVGIYKQSNFAFTESPGWPIGKGTFGQVTAVDVDKNGNIIIFHRGNHVWNEKLS